MVEQVLEVVKRYELTIEGLGYPVFAKIVKHKDEEKYGWSISHFYQPENAAGIYTPGDADTPEYKTLKDAIHYLFFYANNFTAKKRVEENPLFIK